MNLSGPSLQCLHCVGAAPTKKKRGRDGDPNLRYSNCLEYQHNWLHSGDDPCNKLLVLGISWARAPMPSCFERFLSNIVYVSRAGCQFHNDVASNPAVIYLPKLRPGEGPKSRNNPQP